MPESLLILIGVTIAYNTSPLEPPVGKKAMTIVTMAIAALYALAKLLDVGLG